MLNQRMGVDGQFEGEKGTSDNLWSIFADRAALGKIARIDEKTLRALILPPYPTLSQLNKKLAILGSLLCDRPGASG